MLQMALRHCSTTGGSRSRQSTLHIARSAQKIGKRKMSGRTVAQISGPSPQGPFSQWCVKAEPRGAEGHDLQQPARHHDVLEKVEELVLVGEVIVEGECRSHRVRSEHRRDDARSVARNQSEPTDDFDEGGDRDSDLRNGSPTDWM